MGRYLIWKGNEMHNTLTSTVETYEHEAKVAWEEAKAARNIYLIAISKAKATEIKFRAAKAELKDMGDLVIV